MGGGERNGEQFVVPPVLCGSFAVLSQIPTPPEEARNTRESFGGSPGVGKVPRGGQLTSRHPEGTRHRPQPAGSPPRTPSPMPETLWRAKPTGTPQPGGNQPPPLGVPVPGWITPGV